MSDEVHAAATATPAKARKPRAAPKKKNHSVTAILLAVSIILGLANLLLFVKLGLLR